MGELVARFFLGGIIVSLFALIGEKVKPKSLSGIFGGAPSVALATLGLAFASKGARYASTEGRSMILGAVALVVYSVLVGWLVLVLRERPLLVAPLSWAAWLVVALGLSAVVLG